MRSFNAIGLRAQFREGEHDAEVRRYVTAYREQPETGKKSMPPGGTHGGPSRGCPGATVEARRSVVGQDRPATTGGPGVPLRSVRRTQRVIVAPAMTMVRGIAAEVKVGRREGLPAGMRRQLRLVGHPSQDSSPRRPDRAPVTGRANAPRSVRRIGIDDGSAGPYQQPMDDAVDAFCELFPAVYLRFCRRQERTSRTRLTPQQDAALHHLAMSGPLTIGEMTRHFARAQSVVSEMVGGLEAKGLLERMRDSRDGRRTLIWLTDEGRDVLAQRAQVLDTVRVGRAMRSLPDRQRRALIDAMRALVRAGGDAHDMRRVTRRRDDHE